MRNLALVCAALAVVSTVISINLWRELRDERQLTAQMRDQLAQAAAPAAPVMPLPPPRAVAAPAADTATAQQQAPAPADVPAAPPARAASSSVILNQRELLKDPEYRQAALAQMRLNMDQNYPGLIEELGLAPDLADQVFDLLAELQLERNASSITIAANGQPDQAAMAEMTRRNQELQQRQDEQLTALLGSDGLQRFRAYEQTRGPRMQAQSMRRMLESAGVPLSDAQMRPLTDVYIAEQRRQREEIEALARTISPAGNAQQQFQERNLQLQEERNRRLLEAGRAHLTGPQFERFQAMIEQQQMMSRASSRVMRQRLEAQQAEGAPAAGGVVTLIP